MLGYPEVRRLTSTLIWIYWCVLTSFLVRCHNFFFPWPAHQQLKINILLEEERVFLARTTLLQMTHAAVLYVWCFQLGCVLDFSANIPGLPSHSIIADWLRGIQSDTLRLLHLKLLAPGYACIVCSTWGASSVGSSDFIFCVFDELLMYFSCPCGDGIGQGDPRHGCMTFRSDVLRVENKGLRVEETPQKKYINLFLATRHGMYVVYRIKTWSVCVV